MSFVRFLVELLALLVVLAIWVVASTWIAVMVLDWVNSDRKLTLVRFAGLRLADAWRILRGIV